MRKNLGRISRAAMAVCAVLIIDRGILAILNEPKIEPAAQPTQPAQPAAQATEPLVKQEQAQTEPTEPAEPPATRDLRNGDHATLKMNKLASKTMAYFDRWAAPVKT